MLTGMLTYNEYGTQGPIKALPPRRPPPPAPLPPPAPSQ